MVIKNGKGNVLNCLSKRNKKTEVLDDKVDEFIDWFTEKISRENYTEIGDYTIPKDIRNLIEKIAVWYELRHPDFEVANAMPIIDALAVGDIKAFNDELSLDSSYNFLYPQYRRIVYLDSNNRYAHLHLDKDGFVRMSERMDSVIPDISDDDLVGKNIKEIVSMMQEKGIKLPESNEFEQAIKDYDNQVYQRDGILDCAMYRIIERGQNRIGPRRAFMFAKTFGRNIDIPMAYGVDLSDPELRLFMNEYIKAGGFKDLNCFVGYGKRSSKNESLSTITMQELIKNHSLNGINFYTPEEDALHQRLVNALSMQLNQCEGTENQQRTSENVKQLKLEKKLTPSKDTDDLK